MWLEATLLENATLGFRNFHHLFTSWQMTVSMFESTLQVSLAIENLSKVTYIWYWVLFWRKYCQKLSEAHDCFFRFFFSFENIWIQNVLLGYFMMVASQVNMNILTEMCMLNFLSYLAKWSFFFCLKLPLLALGNCANFDFSHFIDKLILKLIISDTSYNKYWLVSSYCYLIWKN